MSTKGTESSSDKDVYIDNSINCISPADFVRYVPEMSAVLDVSLVNKYCESVGVDVNQLKQDENNPNPRLIIPYALVYAVCVDENICDGVVSTFLESDYLYRDRLVTDIKSGIECCMDPRVARTPYRMHAIKNTMETYLKKEGTVCEKISYDACSVNDIAPLGEGSCARTTDCHRSRVHYSTDAHMYKFWSEVNEKTNGFDHNIRHLLKQSTNQDHCVNTVEMCDYFELFLFTPDFTRSFTNTFNGGFETMLEQAQDRVGLYRNNIMVWMTFLNDISDGGEVFFPQWNRKVRPIKGLTLMWPATHTYRHVLLPSAQERLIAKGFFQMDGGMKKFCNTNL